jgi:hypothetical protein
MMRADKLFLNFIISASSFSDLANIDYDRSKQTKDIKQIDDNRRSCGTTLRTKILTTTLILEVPYELDNPF